MKIDQKITDRLQQLIDFEAEVMKTRKAGGGNSLYDPPYDFVNNEIANQWGVSCLNILKRVFGADSDHYTKFEAIYSKFPRTSSIKNALGVFKAAKDDYDNGHLFETRILVEAELFDDFLEMAEHLFGNGYHEPAAVIAGCVLEDGLRKLCMHNSIILQPNTALDVMNTELARKGVYTKLVQKRITVLAHIRNKAAHGQWAEFSKGDVEEMLSQVRLFMENHFS